MCGAHATTSSSAAAASPCADEVGTAAAAATTTTTTTKTTTKTTTTEAEAVPAAAEDTADTADTAAEAAASVVVCDGSEYDPMKPYLFATLGNHTVHPMEDQTEHLGFDATSNRLIATVSLHDRCGVIVSPTKHAAALQPLGYPVVSWGQTVAFPMCAKAIKAMGVGGAYPGSVVVHTFTEPASLHNKVHTATGTLVGDGAFDGLNHLAGAYIPLALALQCATAGDTHVNLETKNSGINLQKHSIDLVVGGNFTSLCFKDNTGGSLAANGVITHSSHADSDHLPLVVGKRQLLQGFEQLVQEMSGCDNSFSKNLSDSVATSIEKGVFAKYDKKLEGDIRLFAANRPRVDTQQQQAAASHNTTEAVAATAAAAAAAAAVQPIDMCDLPPLLQTSFCTTSMVAMQQPGPISAPTVVMPTAAATAAADDDDSGSSKSSTGTGTAADIAAAAADANDVTEADKYGGRFSTYSYALEPHHNLRAGDNIHQFFGVVALSHALFLSQTSTQEAYDICAPFADPDSAFLDCNQASCECNAKTQRSTPHSAPSRVNHNNKTATKTTTAVSARFERMLRGVSQNIALSNTAKTVMCVATPSCAAAAAAATNINNATASSLSSSSSRPVVSAVPHSGGRDDIVCKAATSFCGTCSCTACVNNGKLLHLAQLLTSCTHAFQKCDNYIPDQTMCSVNADGVPQYTATESMLPFGTALKAVMMKTGTSVTDKVVMRVGMNSDDCENSAFESKAVLDTLRAGSECVSRDFFHGSKDNPSSSSTYSSAKDEETLRCMRLGNLSKTEQRHILLAAQVIGTKVQAHLGYFVTGAASQANDMKHVDARSSSSSSTTNGAASAVHSPPSSQRAAAATMSVTLPSTQGGGLNAFGCKPPGQRISSSHGRTTDAAEASGLSGHCTCTLSILRNDGFLHSTVVEGTAHVRTAAGDVPCEVRHRGLLSAKIEDNKRVAGAAGYFKGPITVDNAVDVTIKGLLSSHVSSISTRLQVPGSNMRACMFMGTSEHVSGNCDTFYKKIVSTGPYQCVQRDGQNGVQPGADIKKFLNQRVHPIIPKEVAALGEDAVVKHMGASTCAMIQVVDTKSPAYKKFEDDSHLFRRTMSPLRLSPANQDRHMLSALGSLASLQVNFPDDAKLKNDNKMSTFTCFVTHVPTGDTLEAHNKVLNGIENHVLQMNSEYVNVRVAKPVVTGSGEIVTLYRIYGVPLDTLA